MVSSILTSLALASLAALGSANVVPAVSVSATSTAAASASTVPALTIQMPIDHFASNPTAKTYSNRYWVNATYYKAGGPVFYYDPGEQTVTSTAVNVILKESTGPSAVMQLAAKYNGLGVMMEHRFYGQSDPYPISTSTGLAPAGYEAYQYLTVEQALEDVVYLAENIAPPGLDASQLKPTQVPWIFMGGSYPGARAAWIRIRNPDVIYASWASSAPVQTTIDMSTYFEQVAQDMTKNCSSDLAAASQYLTNKLTSGTSSEKAVIKIISFLAADPPAVAQLKGKSDSYILSQFSDDDVTDFDLAKLLGNFVGSGLQSYGFSVALLPYCDAVESFDVNSVDTSSLSALISTVFTNPDDATVKDVGIAQTVGNVDQGGEASFLAMMYGIYQQTLVALQNSGTGVSNPYARGDARSWEYQTCTEFGYFQVANGSSPDNLLSTFINVTAWEYEYCTRVYQWSQLPKLPNVNALDAKYGGWNMNPSQVMFTDGLKDPWHTLSTQSTSVEIGAPNRKTVQDVPACGKSPDSNNVFGLLYPDAYHASDLHGAKQTFYDGLALFEKALDVWLPCFQKHSITSNTTSGASPAASAIPTGSSSGSGTATSSTPSSSPTGGAADLAGSRSTLLLGATSALLAAMLML